MESYAVTVVLTEDELRTLHSEMYRRYRKLTESGDYPERKRDQFLIDKLLDAKWRVNTEKRKKERSHARED
jgi:hypothetical protein